MDPSYYLSLPSLCWDIALKISKIQLELLTDENMLMIFEKAKRGGLSQCSKRYIKANNKYLPNYDPTKLSTYLLYIDATNLYGKAMTMPLPYKNFKENNDLVIKLNSKINENYNHFLKEIYTYEDLGMQFVVDLEYPKELHDLHNNYPLAPEHRKVNKVDKLLTLYDKEDYSVHIKTLCLCHRNSSRSKLYYQIYLQNYFIITRLVLSQTFTKITINSVINEILI